MNFGYDEYGNREADSGSEEEEEVRSGNNSGSNSNESSSSGSYSDASSSSDFSDDVELIVGEAPAAGAEQQPLVSAAQVVGGSGKGKVRADGEKPLLLEAAAGGGGQQQQQLLLEERARRAPLESFLETVAAVPSRHRSIAVIGALHHGKTAFVETLLQPAATSSSLAPGQPRRTSKKAAAPTTNPNLRPTSVAYHHKREDEKSREMSIKSHVLSGVIAGAQLHPASHLFTVVDTPGHPDLVGEALAGLRLADAAVLCVDVVEGLLSHTEFLLRHLLLREQMPFVLVLTKLDRLILELKLPPLDAYRKLRLIVDEVNNVVASCGCDGSSPAVGGNFLVSPENGTVCFSSCRLGCFFSLETFALKYSEVYPTVPARALARKLWGQLTFEKGRFVPLKGLMKPPSFVSFVLEPIYKILANSVAGKGSSTLSPALSSLPASPLEAMQEAVQLFCGVPGPAAADALLSVLPEAGERNRWLAHQYRAETLCAGGDAVAVSPMLHLDDAQEVSLIVRVIAGRLDAAALRRGLESVSTLSNEAEPFSTLRPTQMLARTATEGFLPVKVAHAGQVVYLGGVGQYTGGTHQLLRPAATENEEEEEEGSGEAAGAWAGEVQLYPTTTVERPALVHVAVEVKEPAKADRVLRGLQLLQLTTPGLDFEKEETGEFTLTGMGELHLDSALHELRRVLCRGVRVGLSQPFASFRETVLDAEGLLASAGARHTRVECTSGALRPQAHRRAVGSAQDRPSFTRALEYEQLSLFPSGGDADGDGAVKLWSVLRRHYDYEFDALDAQHIIAVGPDRTKGTCILIDDRLAEEAVEGRELTLAQRVTVERAFRSAVSAGPLVGEPVREAVVRLIHAQADRQCSERELRMFAASAVRRALLGARPRLLEPVYAGEVLAPQQSIDAIREVLQLRRGAVVSEEPIPATTLFRVGVLVPVMDSFGLETQIRMKTLGQAYPTFTFSKWDIVPGDPYDASIVVAPLEPARGHQLARDFVLKTRFRKGLSSQLMMEL